MGDDGGSEQERQQATTPDTGTANAQADDQSSESPVTSPQQRRGRFLGRFRRRRATDNAEQAGASTEQPAKKSKIGLLGIVITAIVGFIFGIGSNQVSDFVKRADDCLDSLSQYLVGIENFINSPYASHLTTKPPDQTPPDQTPPDQTPPDQANTEILKFNTVIVLPSIKVLNKCPMRGRPENPDDLNTEYLNSDVVKSWNDNLDKLRQYCYPRFECSDGTAISDLWDLANSTYTLIGEANDVSRWGLVRRAKYEFTHLY